MGLLTGRRRRPIACAVALASAISSLQTVVHGSPREVTLEYQVKAAFLFNFVKFVEWPTPSRAAARPLTICVAERNPFGTSLREAVEGEKIDGRAVDTRVVDHPDTGCDVMFVPRGTAPERYLEAYRDSATLTVGEDSGFLSKGGIINFVIEGSSVRFEIDSSAAKRADLRISSHLLRLSRPTASRG